MPHLQLSFPKFPASPPKVEFRGALPCAPDRLSHHPSGPPRPTAPHSICVPAAKLRESPQSAILVFTRGLRGAPTGSVYLGTGGPPGSRHLLLQQQLAWQPLENGHLSSVPADESPPFVESRCSRRPRHNRRAGFPAADLSPGLEGARQALRQPLECFLSSCPVQIT